MDPANCIGVLLSGGLDSAVLLAELAGRFAHVHPFYVRCGLLWETAEYAHAQRFLAALNRPTVERLVTFDVPLADVYADHWSITGGRVPPAGSADEAVYLPARNVLLLVKPAIWCHLHGIGRLALGPLKSNPFPDSTPDFYRDYQSALNRALGSGLEIVRPLERLTKVEVLRRGASLPLELTFSCIQPTDGLHCGRCNKCAERQGAFQGAGLPDRTPYVSQAT